MAFKSPKPRSAYASPEYRSARENAVATVEQTESTSSHALALVEEGSPPPDGGYGWVCCAACFTVNCFTWGVVAVSISAESVRLCMLKQRPSWALRHYCCNGIVFHGANRTSNSHMEYISPIISPLSHFRERLPWTTRLLAGSTSR